MRKFLIIFICLLPLLSLAQTSNVTATITDTDGQVWNNGTYIINFVPTPGNPGPYTQNGIPFNQGPFTGVLSNSGVLTITLPDNSTIQPSGSQWQFVICPNATSPCGNKNVAVIGANPNISTTLSAYVPVVRFPAINQAYGYVDSEVTPTPNPGGSYWNVTTGCLRLWSGTIWACSTGTITDLSSPPPIGNVTPNSIFAKPLCISGGPAGNTTWRCLNESVNSTTGDYLVQYLTSTGSPSDTFVFGQQQFYPYFKPGPASQAGGNGMGVWVQTVPMQAYIYTGGQPWQGTLSTFSMPDPTTACTVTHTGGGSTGVTYYLRFLDALQHYTNYIACTDSTGYPTPVPASGNYNIIHYVQSQGGANDYGGSFSDLLVARGNASTGVLNLSGLGTISNLTPCQNVASNPCTFIDDGSAPLVTLAAAEGLAYDYVEGNNTNDLTAQGRLTVLTRGSSLYGGINESGQIRTVPIPVPSAPTVTPNVTGSTTISYAIIVNDATTGTIATDGTLGHTLPSADTTITNSASTANNTISWNITFNCSSVTVLKHSGGSYFAMPGSTILPCYGHNLVGGFGTYQNSTYVDIGGTYTSFTPVIRTTTADIFLDNTGATGQGASIYALNGLAESYYLVAINNITSLSAFFCTLAGSTCAGSSAYARILSGNSTTFPAYTIFDNAGTALEAGAFGGDAISSGIITLKGLNSYKLNIASLNIMLANNGTEIVDPSANIIGTTFTVATGTNVVYRCATAGSLSAGALTITAGDCGSTVDTGLRVK